MTLQDTLVSLASLYGPIGSVLAMLDEDSLELLKAASELLNGVSLELLSLISEQLVGELDELDVMSFGLLEMTGEYSLSPPQLAQKNAAVEIKIFLEIFRMFIQNSFKY